MVLARERHSLAALRMNRSVAALVVVALLVGGLLPLAFSAPHAATGPLNTPRPAPAVAGVDNPATPTFGPVVVPSGTTIWWNGTGESDVQLQEGNVTVEPGGTLIVQNLTVSMVQFVTGSGTLAERLSNIFRFLDEGTVTLRNAILTTDPNVTNAYLKLNLTVTGNLSLWKSSLEFPGSLTVASGANVVLNSSEVTANPAVNDSDLDQTIIGDTSFAPSVLVAAGGTLTLLNSSLERTYADNVSQNGSPGPLALTDNDTVSVTPASNVELSNFQTPTGSQSLIQDWLYPVSYPAIDLVFVYSMTTGSVTSAINLTFDGITQPISSATFNPGANVSLTLALPTSLLSIINSAGPAGFLSSTGSFDHNVPYLSVGIGATGIGTSSVTIYRTMLLAMPALKFDIQVAGSGARIQSLDSSLAINWAALPDSPYSVSPPLPWDSNKLELEGGAIALLANLSIPTPPPIAGAVSAVQADSTSSVFTFRWAEFNVTGPGGQVPRARVEAFPTAEGTTNTTVTALNDLATSSPALWSYVQWWDGERGLPGYGSTGITGAVEGRAYLLLASTNVSASATVTPTFIGEYSVGVQIPLANVSTQWFPFNVTPYPTGLTDPMPDMAPATFFPQFAAALAVASVTLSTENGESTGSILIGQQLDIAVVVKNVGATPVYNLSGLVRYTAPASPSGLNVSTFPLTGITLASGGSTTLNFTWGVNETTVGHHGRISATLSVLIDWNGGPSLSDGGVTRATAPVLILPSTVSITLLQAPPQTLSGSATYVTDGVVVFNGSGLASINLTATPVAGGLPILIATNLSLNGSFELTLAQLGQLLQPGTAYTFAAIASYNSANSSAYVLAGSFSLAGSSSSGGSVVPWWVWAIVAVGAAVGVAVFLVRRRRPAPQIECGECAGLAPADAETCPTCGIFFERGESRCPRCGGPILPGELSCTSCQYMPADRPGPLGPEEDREKYRAHTEIFRAAAQGEIGEDYPEVEFWKWWRRQPSYQSFRDWKSGQSAPPKGPIGGDSDPLGIGDGK